MSEHKLPTQCACVSKHSIATGINVSFPQKWTSGDVQLVFPGNTKLEIMLLRKK
jgi:hypothetical protein